MIAFFQLASIRCHEREVCDLDHMNMFAAPAANLPRLPDASWLSRPIRSTVAYVGVES
jgi:hypothetical protein